MKTNKKLQKIKVTEDDFKNFSKIVSIPKNLEKQEKRWEEQRKFNEKQEKRWKEQEKFNERILALVEMLIKRIDNLVIKNNLKE